jgi:hypothetical protein
MGRRLNQYFEWLHDKPNDRPIERKGRMRLRPARHSDHIPAQNVGDAKKKIGTQIASDALDTPLMEAMRHAYD